MGSPNSRVSPLRWRAMETHLGVLEDHPGARKAHPDVMMPLSAITLSQDHRASETHFEATKVHPEALSR
jgi:hypothetical protein